MSSERIRLHIAPFNATLFERIVPASMRRIATNVSFHAIETFPEHEFGYLELPTADGLALRKKISGTTMKGNLISVEEAREHPKRQVERQVEDVQVGSTTRCEGLPRSEKRRSGGLVLSGHQLEDGRHVHRGWTKARKGQTSHGRENSKTLEGRKEEGFVEGEMRFRTSMPATAAPPFGDTKDGKKPKSKSMQKKGKQMIVVEEFNKHKRAADTALPPWRGAMVYEDGKGWVADTPRPLDSHQLDSRKVDERLHRSDSAVGATKFITTETRPDRKQSRALATQVVDNSVPGSGSGLPSNRESMRINSRPSSPSNGLSSDEVVDGVQRLPKIAASTVVTTPGELHPLQALYRRPYRPGDSVGITENLRMRPGAAEAKIIDSPFSFFRPDSNVTKDSLENDGGFASWPPGTPHTKEDLQSRGIRSAAPTPDTAAIGKRFSFPIVGGDEKEPKSEDLAPKKLPGELDAGSAIQQDRMESDFAKWFFDNRGAMNRAWKKQRRAAKKENRQRENRRLSRRLV